MSVLLNLNSENIAVNGKVAGNASRAEIALIRCYLNIGFSRLKDSMISLSTNLEAATTLECENNGSLLSVLYESVLNKDTKTQTTAPASEQVGSFVGPTETLNYLKTLQWIEKNVSPNEKITPELILDLHSRCVYGKGHHQSGVKFRKEYFYFAKPSEYSEAIPHTERIYTQMSDLCDFINKDIYSPIVQASFSHYQMECIRPFELSEVRTSLALFHVILFKRGLVRNTVVPISLLSRLNSDLYSTIQHELTEVKEPQDLVYKLNKWIGYCSGATELAANTMNTLNSSFECLESTWQQRLGNLSRGSSVESILLLLPAHPLVTVESVMDLTGKGFSATNDALARLVDAEVLTVTPNPYQRTRIFRAEEVFQIYKRTLGNILPHYVLSSAFRENLLD